MKKGKQSLVFKNVFINNTATVVGPLEGRGPLGSYFDHITPDLRCNMKSFEEAEILMQTNAINMLLDKTLSLQTDIDCLFAGDLINQNAVTNYTMRNFDIPYIGIYGACSTSVLGILLASILIEGGNAKNCITLTSSHNSTSERQYRYPIEYGGAKEKRETFTVTGSSAVLLTNEAKKVKVTKGTIGKVIDVGFKDSKDMGRAMAPAAVETLISFFNDFNETPSDYDLILTGDLSNNGYKIVNKLLLEHFGREVVNYNDCGRLIFDTKSQNVMSGGSGCSCCGVVTFGYIYKKMLEGVYKKVLICATGALMNPTMVMQNESIPVISHAMVLEV